MSNEALTIVLAIIAAVGASVVTGIFTRPKVNAEAKAATAGGEVSISGDARAWAATFAERADRAEARAAAAEERADAAELEVAEVRRVAAEQNAEVRRELEKTNAKLNDCVDYVLTLQRQVRMGSDTPADPPASLRPPL